MPAGPYRPPDGYLTLRQAQAYLGVSKQILQRLTRAGTLATYADQRNCRVRLVRADDLKRLMEPIPLATPTT